MTQEPKKSRIEVLEEVINGIAAKVQDIANKVEALEKAPPSAAKVKAGLFGGKRERAAIKDTKTGKVYPSKSAVGKALASEADTTSDDHFAWYKLLAKFPDRFVAASPTEGAKAQAEADAVLQEEVDEANKKFAAEQQKKAAGKK